MRSKILNDFCFHKPTTLEEAMGLIDRYQEGGLLMAGGSEVIPNMKSLVVTPDHIISLKHIPEFDYLRYTPGEGLHIGPTTPLTHIEYNPDVQRVYPSLFQGIHGMSNTNIHNTSTVTGNICYAVPSADTAAPLLTLEAVLTVRSVEGERIVPIGELFAGVRRTTLKKNEIVTDIFVPEPQEGALMAYYKNPCRKALDLAIAGVATYVVMDGEVCREARIAMSAVAVVPKRAPEAEVMLKGQVLSAELIEKAAEHASLHECSPISDIRASAEYRRELVRLSVRDGLTLALNK
ncbi:MAG TPA: xanthine dehydrogenase family protein subunit M [Candidatus Scatomorpha merdipullorum]|uniref:Xanthine dehydrogenase family protein subunit M n=1 Tax=Candidatus Scatomorpha merdipullorum TaxID=2840927 RepID=A0A9D1FDK8_9FIRM|nr:xanthine dehydrogenase family protein subunit M [Candidatus Scatomorpha merdipullorum]